jgi:hypothetical protein
MNAGIKKLKEICSSQMLHGNSRTQDIIIQSLPCIAWLTLELVLYPLLQILCSINDLAANVLVQFTSQG